GKRYSLRHLRDQRYVALRDVLVEKATGLFRRSPKGRSKIASGSVEPTARREDRRSKNASPASSSHLPSTTTSSREDFWALKDVSFDVKRGEVVGIIGRNGAGKSTLLKILSRITEPTEGRFRLRGRVASLLEVGTGFHPELTGRENIYLNGAILGMGKREIKKKFDRIVDFAETAKFLDTPVKYYSSGMYVRLAFAVAAPVGKAAEHYLASRPGAFRVGEANLHNRMQRTTGTARFEEVRARDDAGQERWTFRSGETVCLCLAVRVLERVPNMGVYLAIKSGGSREVLTTIKEVVAEADVAAGSQ